MDVKLLQLLKDPSVLGEMRTLYKKRVEQSRDSYSTLQSLTTLRERSVFEGYPSSPIAQRFLQAYDLFFNGRILLELYDKDNAETDADCSRLEPALHKYAKAFVCENSLYEQFRPPENIRKLLDEYLILRPKDLLAQYLKVVTTIRPDPLTYRKGKFSDYELQKTSIITLEEFVHKRLKQKKKSAINNQIIAESYYLLGSIYSITDQSLRARVSFQGCYDFDSNSHGAIFGIAYHHMYTDPDEAVTLFLKYIDVAPICDKQYPDAFYNLALLYYDQYRNTSEAMRYYKLGEKAEKQRLPFLEPFDTPSKQMMKLILERKLDAY